MKLWTPKSPFSMPIELEVNRLALCHSSMYSTSIIISGMQTPSPISLGLPDLGRISNILSIGTEDDSQSKLILDFISACVAKVGSGGKPSVSASRL
jgi:hypothetical protein